MPPDEPLDAVPQRDRVHGDSVDTRGIIGLRIGTDISRMSFLEAWLRRESVRQAAEWGEERTAARRAVEDVPSAVRSDVARVIETLLDGPDADVQSALDELWRLLEPYPELSERFFRLRVVDDAVEFLKS